MGVALAACSDDERPPPSASLGGANGGSTSTNGGSSAAGTSMGGSSGSAAGTGGSAGSGGTAIGGTGGVSIDCSSAEGPPMVGLQAPGGLELCIDTTEVTNAHYEAFLADAPALDSQPASCAWNTSFTPGGTWPADSQRAQHPVVNVDYCDALAFCSWAGKSLCGHQDGSGRVSQAVGLTSRQVSQWYVACSGEGADYPYGSAYDSSACNGTTGDAHPVGSLASCSGSSKPFDQIFDLVGNVQEWEQNCIDVAMDGSDQCITRGGSFDTATAPETKLWCASISEARPQSDQRPDLGFRCCRDETL